MRHEFRNRRIFQWPDHVIQNSRRSLWPQKPMKSARLLSSPPLRPNSVSVSAEPRTTGSNISDFSPMLFAPFEIGENPAIENGGRAALRSQNHHQKSDRLLSSPPFGPNSVSASA